MGRLQGRSSQTHGALVRPPPLFGELGLAPVDDPAAGADDRRHLLEPSSGKSIAPANGRRREPDQDIVRDEVEFETGMTARAGSRRWRRSGPKARGRPAALLSPVADGGRGRCVRGGDPDRCRDRADDRDARSFRELLRSRSISRPGGSRTLRGPSANHLMALGGRLRR